MNFVSLILTEPNRQGIPSALFLRLFARPAILLHNGLRATTIVYAPPFHGRISSPPPTSIVFLSLVSLVILSPILILSYNIIPLRGRLSSVPPAACWIFCAKVGCLSDLSSTALFRKCHGPPSVTLILICGVHISSQISVAAFRFLLPHSFG